MGRLLLLSFVVLAQILRAQAMAARSERPNEALVRTGDEAPHVSVAFSLADPPSSAGGGNGGVRESSSEGEAEPADLAQPPGIRRLGRHRHAPDKSVAGGGIIIGGLFTVVFAAVYSYIRVTGRRADDEKH